jgi:hypothetical protein
MYAFETRASDGRTAEPRVDGIAATEEGVVRDMARCLVEIREGRVPK